LRYNCFSGKYKYCLVKATLERESNTLQSVYGTLFFLNLFSERYGELLFFREEM
jgi:hypothetical protein